MDKVVSILIPIYNAEKYITRCINSVIEQNYNNLEIVLVDDGSKDKSLSICESFAKKDSRIKIIKQKNKGVSSARNKAIENATGEYVTFLDADDSIEKQYIQELIKYHEKNSLTRCRYSSTREKSINQTEYIDLIAKGKVAGVCWGYLFEKELLNELRFDENVSYMEDTIFIIQYILKIKKVIIVNDAIYNYNQNEESLTQRNADVSKRIYGYSYSIDRIGDILKNSKFNYYNELNERKVKLFESEIAKIQSMQQLIDLLNSNKFDIINANNNTKFIYRIVIYLVKNKRVHAIFLYIKIRNIIKKCVKKECF